MRPTRQEAVRAGALALAAILAFLAFLFVLVGRNLLRDTQPYRTAFDSTVEGLDRGSRVSYLGVPAGKVTDIRFQPDNFPAIEIRMQVAKHIPITETTRATLSVRLLTGQAHIELIGGDEGEERLPPHSLIPSEPSEVERIYRSIPALIERVAGVLMNVEEVSMHLAALLAPPFPDDARAALQELQATTVAARQFLERTTPLMEEELPTLLATLERESRATGAAVRELVGEDARAALENLRLASERLLSFLGSAERAAARVEGVLDRGILEELRAVLREMQALVRDVRQDPGRLLAPPPPARRIPEAEPSGRQR